MFKGCDHHCFPGIQRYYSHPGCIASRSAQRLVQASRFLRVRQCTEISKRIRHTGWKSTCIMCVFLETWNMSVLWVVLLWFPIAPFDTGTSMRRWLYRNENNLTVMSGAQICQRSSAPFRSVWHSPLKESARSIQKGRFAKSSPVLWSRKIKCPYKKVWSIERVKVLYSLSHLPVDHQSRTLPRCCLSPCVAPSIQNQPKNHSLHDTDPEILSIAALASISITLWFIDGLVIWTPKECQKARGRQSHRFHQDFKIDSPLRMPGYQGEED